MSTRLFDRPPELSPVSHSEISLVEEAEATGTARISRLDVEQVLARLQQDASPARAREKMQEASSRRGGRLRKLLLPAVVFAGCTFVWMHPERDVLQLARHGRIAMRDCQATYDAILPFVQGR